MQINPTTLSNLEEAARKATPGPWQVAAEDGSIEPVLPSGTIAQFEDTGWNRKQTDANAAFIAACSPDTILALIARIIELEGALGKYGAHEEYCRSIPCTCGSCAGGCFTGDICNCGFDTALGGKES